MRRLNAYIAVFFCLVLPSATWAAAPVCGDPAYRQFDFWLGDWNVTTPDGKLVGHERVEKRYGDCVLADEFTGVQSGTGGSFNIYDRHRKVWHQTWVDSWGLLLQLDGGLKDGRMVLSGEHVNKEGKKVLDRMTWTPEKGAVHQLWESSADGGKTWKVEFDVVYHKAS